MERDREGQRETEGERGEEPQQLNIIMGKRKYSTNLICCLV